MASYDAASNSSIRPFAQVATDAEASGMDELVTAKELTLAMIADVTCGAQSILVNDLEAGAHTCPKFGSP
jgi:hypothetical protein